ncbi:ABC-F family ATP-binding cassette domain-containing protein [Rhodococcus sp. HNM0569]|uniref:ABC-F family ATP-binding cassette domain-containing protein n=1 Tax=Rhodococcus sp. HNM0569 TaxID=2716340 RepID=UPI00146D637D|nr:ABC-F family ATP-binding cassette domain-containing protein [Rhodococcus sp. HNM0569]NLU82482.1 ABC-F family ATP-binding cassette domain-containing protein [Rhodococcus sp. HNM0569]
MPATLHLRGFGAARGSRVLFSGLDLVVAPGDVVGLTGANGAGKSTLLSSIVHAVDPAVAAGPGAADVEGTVAASPPDATVGLLAQEPERVAGETVATLLARRTGVADAERAMNAAAETLADGGDDLYSPALDRWLGLGGADLDDRADKVLADLGLDVPLDTPTTALSGGQAARVGLAALLLSRFDVLLLDEPTNDLDLAGLEQLERFVQDSRAGIVVVSHDREFLARTTTSIVELDAAQHQITVFDGGYEAYLVEREVARRHAREAYDEYANTRAALEERARMQRGWMEHGVRNARRKSKDNDKIGKAMRAEATEKQAAKARQTQRRIERLDEVAEPRKEWDLRFDIASAGRSGTVVVTATDAVVHRGRFTLGPVTLQVDYGDRVLVTGPNGAGKTTLLNLLLGRVAPDSGSVSLGSAVVVGEIDQARQHFGDDRTLAEAFGAEVSDWPDADVRTLLAKFGLRGDLALTPCAALSPGERTRAALALLQARGVNLLVLDEPTNHLDLPAIEQLEQALDRFDGTVLLVTHDRRMLDSTRSTVRWAVDDGQVDVTAGT